MKFDSIGFIGLGLIGGSIAKSIKEKYPDTKIIAIASRESTVKEAYTEGVISNNTLLPLDAFAECDVIFLCSPVKVNVTYLEKLKNIIPEDCIITDVGSVKGDITSAVASLGLTKQFIGGHPMAGAEASGYSNASATLIENAYYILTTSEDFDQTTLHTFEKYISSLGGLTMTMRPEKHDFATACISHLPHIIAASLVKFVKEADYDDEVMKTIAAGGFRDITRIASSSPIMWQNICSTNRDQILKAAIQFSDTLNCFIDDIANSDDEAIINDFSLAKDYRDNLPISKNGVLPAAYELYLDLADKTGGIATIATLLASNDINIKNIGIVHNREFEQGVLRIEFYSDDSLNEAIQVLEKNYTIYKQ